MPAKTWCGPRVEIGVDARVVDARALPFVGEFDAVFSNAALHWMGPPEPIVRGVTRALRPGGRFVGECGGRGNVAVVIAALRAALIARGVDFDRVNPWYYSDVEEYRDIFDRLGWRILSLELFDRPTLLPGSLSDWLETFAGKFLVSVAAADRAGVPRRSLRSMCAGATQRRRSMDAGLRAAAFRGGAARSLVDRPPGVTTSAQRLHGLDALRAWALLLGISCTPRCRISRLPVRGRLAPTSPWHSLAGSSTTSTASASRSSF